MDILKELNAMMDITLKPEFELAINEVIEKSYKADIDKLGLGMAILVKSQWEQMKPYLFFAYCLSAKAQAVPNLHHEILVKSIIEHVDSHLEANFLDNDSFDRGWKAAMQCVRNNITRISKRKDLANAKN